MILIGHRDTLVHYETINTLTIAWSVGLGIFYILVGWVCDWLPNRESLLFSSTLDLILMMPFVSLS